MALLATVAYAVVDTLSKYQAREYPVGMIVWARYAVPLVLLLAVFLPSFFLVAGTLPFWEGLRCHTRTQAALTGINAAVVGLLLAALYQPVWTSAILGTKDFCLALVAFVCLVAWKVAPWLVVAGSGAAGWVLAY